MSANTYNEKNVKERFGENNYDIIISWCENYRITETQLLEIAKEIDERIKGRLIQLKKKEEYANDLRFLCRNMLSYWWQLDGGDGVQLQKIIKILKDPNINLNDLATELSTNVKSSETADKMATPIRVKTGGQEGTQGQEREGGIGELARSTGSDVTDSSSQVSNGNETETCINNAFQSLGWKRKRPSGNGVRKAILIGNTYKNTKQPLKGCEESTKAMERALETNLGSKGKIRFECEVEKNRSATQILKDVEGKCREANDEHADVLLVYICGHGDHEPLEVVNGDAEMEEITSDGAKYVFDNNTLAVVREGGNLIWGDVNGQLEGKLYKNELIAKICKETKNVTHRIIIFDCCRGDLDEEEATMGGTPGATKKTGFALKVELSKLKDLSNKDYKNTFVFHSTLPHQVAWCGKQTTFSKYFSDFVGGSGGVMDINCLDVAINAAIKKDNTKGKHVQMMELIKWVDEPFSW